MRLMYAIVYVALVMLYGPILWIVRCYFQYVAAFKQKQHLGMWRASQGVAHVVLLEEATKLKHLIGTTKMHAIF